MCLQIQIYKPNNGRGCTLTLQPPSPPPLGSVHLKHFTLDALPRRHWRKYSYAALFVSNIRAKTPKVTLYTQRAKFIVMENSDVEVTFYDGEYFEVIFSLVCTYTISRLCVCCHLWAFVLLLELNWHRTDFRVFLCFRQIVCVCVCIHVCLGGSISSQLAISFYLLEIRGFDFAFHLTRTEWPFWCWYTIKIHICAK